MDKEQQRIKIAEACGWIPNPKPHTAKILDWLHVPSGNTSYDPPNYPEDLNAMHEAVSYLTPKQVDVFAVELSAIVLENPSKAWWDLNANEVGHVTNATSAQRAEAFLRTLNLWEE
jgi:hypothetical protein